MQSVWGQTVVTDVTYNPFGPSPTSAADFPQWVIPMEQLQVKPDASINWLQYGLAITANSITREYSLTPAQAAPANGGTVTPSTEKKTVDSTANALESLNADFVLLTRREITNFQVSNLDEEVEAAKQRVADDIAQLQGVIAVVAEDQNLIRLLSTAYRQSTWPDFQNDQTKRQKAAESVFGASATSLTAREVQEAPKGWKSSLDKFIVTIVKDTTRLHNLVQSNDTDQRRRGQTVNIAAHNRAHRKLLNPIIQQADRAIDSGSAVSQQLQTDLQNSALQTERQVLSDAFVQLRDAQAPPLPDAIVIERGKDEVNIEVKLVTLSSYAHPPGQTPHLSERTVKTTLLVAPRMRITASIGPYVSGIVDEQYSLAEDSMQVGSHYKRRKRIVRENSSDWYSYTGITVLTHFEHRSRGPVSWAGSLGAGAQTEGLRILLGGSLLFGDIQRFVVSGGVALGRVTRLSEVYSSDINDPRSKIDPSITVVPTRQANSARPFISITYNLSSAPAK